VLHELTWICMNDINWHGMNVPRLTQFPDLAMKAEGTVGAPTCFLWSKICEFFASIFCSKCGCSLLLFVAGVDFFPLLAVQVLNYLLSDRFSCFSHLLSRELYTSVAFLVSAALSKKLYPSQSWYFAFSIVSSLSLLYVYFTLYYT
jgi:hypothetical protein